MKERIRLRIGHDERGVSEVVGTILVLLITVVLFSAVFVWVYTIPAPEKRTRLEMDAVLTPIYDQGEWDGVIINITHNGGDELFGQWTTVYVSVNNFVERLNTQGTVQYGPNSGDPYGLKGDANWNTGETWSITNYTIGQNDDVEVGVIDNLRQEVVWRKMLLGGEGEHPPLFRERWIDGDLETISREVAEKGKLFGIYARIIDRDGDFNSDNPVFVNLTFLYQQYGLFKMYDDGTHGDAVADDGLWSRTDSLFEAKMEWDGGLLILSAQDDYGQSQGPDVHNTTTRMVLRVTAPKVINRNVEKNETGPRFGPELLPGSELQKYQIYNETEWDEKRWRANSTRTFKKGETVVVIVASVYLPNADIDNKFWLFYAKSGVYPTPIVYGGGPMGPDSVPSSTEAFDLVDYVGNFYVWEYRFNTTSEAYGYTDGLLEYGRYSLRVLLKANYIPPPKNRFETTDLITVTDQNGTAPDYPDLLTFKDSAHLQPSSTFNFTEYMYVKVVVKDTDDTFEIGDVKIQDYVGGIQIWARPGQGPVSSASINNSVSYKFKIDLSSPNYDPWLFGENTYSLRVLLVKDSNEEYIMALSKQVTIRGPRWYLDIATAIEAWSHPVHQTKTYSYFYDNRIFTWEPYPIELFQSFPSKKQPDWGGGPFRSIVFGDIDGDGDLDVVTGAQVGKLFWYRDKDGLGHVWLRKEIDSLGSSVNSVDVGYIDDDTDLDVVIGTENGNLWWYENRGLTWNPYFIDNVGNAVNVVKLGNMDGDKDDDLVVGTSGNEVRIYKNTNGMFGTVVTDDYLMSEDIPGNGTVNGDYMDTFTSDDTYESITETNGTAYETYDYDAQGEQQAVHETVTGDYTDTQTDDNSYETLTEEYIDGPGNNDYYIMRNDTGDTTSGHMYNLGNINASAGDQITLYTSSYISTGSEPFDVGWSTGSTPNWPTGWQITRTGTEGVDSFDLDSQGFNGGQLYIWIRDSDNSKNDGNSDGALTTLSVDYLHVQVVKAGGETSTLDHIWKTEVIGTGGDAYKFFIEAYHTTNTEYDDFTFQWSTSSNGPWTDILTVTKTADDNMYQAANLDNSIAGNAIYIRVIDTNSTNGYLYNDTVYIDHMYVRRYIVQTNYTSIDLGSTVNDLALGDIDNDDDLDIAAGTQSGNIYVLYNQGSGDSFPNTDTLTATGAVLSVDVGFIDSDDDLDVVGGTADDKVYWWENKGVGSWTRKKIDDTNGDVTCLRVGDIDGDYWDDIAIGTSNGDTVHYNNLGSSGWTSEIVDSRDTVVYDLDLGDADRGVTIEPERY